MAPTRALLAAGVVAGPLFVTAFLIQGATRADYDPVRHPVSSLALGEHGWAQTLNFVVAGLLSVAFAAGLRVALHPGRASTWGPLLVGLWGIALLGAGLFVTDPVGGYPPGTPAVPVSRTAPGQIHDAFGLLAWVSLTPACFVLARRFAGLGNRRWATYSAATGVAFAVLWLLSGLGFDQTPGLVEVAGLVQRVAITIGWTWLTLLAVHVLRTRARQGDTVRSRQ